MSVYSCLSMRTWGTRGLIPASSGSRLGRLLNPLKAQDSAHSGASSGSKCQRWQGWDTWVGPERLCRQHRGKCLASLPEASPYVCDLQIQVSFELSRGQPMRIPLLPSVDAWEAAGSHREAVRFRLLPTEFPAHLEQSGLGLHTPCSGLFQQQLNLQRLPKSSLIPSPNRI